MAASIDHDPQWLPATASARAGRTLAEVQGLPRPQTGPILRDLRQTRTDWTRPRRHWRPAARLRALVAWSRAVRALWHAAAYATLCAAGVALYLLLSDPHPPVLAVAVALGAGGLLAVGMYAAGRGGR